MYIRTSHFPGSRTVLVLRTRREEYFPGWIGGGCHRQDVHAVVERGRGGGGPWGWGEDRPKISPNKDSKIFGIC